MISRLYQKVFLLKVSASEAVILLLTLRYINFAFLSIVFDNFPRVDKYSEYSFNFSRKTTVFVLE